MACEYHMRPEDVCPDCEAEKSQEQKIKELEADLVEARGIAEEYRDSLTIGETMPLPWEEDEDLEEMLDDVVNFKHDPEKWQARVRSALEDLQEHMPEATLEKDSHGQLVIYTGVHKRNDGGLEPLE